MLARHWLLASSETRSTQPTHHAGTPLFSVPELEILELHKNRISTISDDFFKSMPRLKRLVLSNNQLKVLPTSLCSCTELKGLQVQENKLISLPSGTWSAALETLFLQAALSSLAPTPRIEASRLPANVFRRTQSWRSCQPSSPNAARYSGATCRSYRLGRVARSPPRFAARSALARKEASTGI